MTRDAALAHLDTYLAQVRRGLRGISDSEIREVLEELRAHVLDRVEGDLTPESVEAALAALGTPREVARINVTERVAAVMEQDRPVFGVLAAVVRLAGLSIAGFGLFIASLIGYGLAGGLAFTAVWKPFDPEHVGFWSSGHGFTMGTLDNPTSPDLLGWWIIPISLAGAAVAAYVTWRLDRYCIRAMARAIRRGRGGP